MGPLCKCKKRISKRREPDGVRRLICARSQETRVCPVEAVWLTVLVRLGCLMCHRTMLTEITWDRVKILHGQNKKRLALRQRTRLRTISFTLEDTSRRLLGMPVSSTLETDTVNAKRSIRALTIITWSTKSQRQLMSNFVRSIWHCSHIRSESKLQYRHLIDNSSESVPSLTIVSGISELLKWTYALQVSFCLSCSSEILPSHIRDILHWDITRTHLACTYLYNS